MKSGKTNKLRSPQGVTDALAHNMRCRRETLRQMHETAVHMPVRRNDLAPNLKMEVVPVEALKPAGRRVRRSDPAQVERVAASIRRFGICVPLVISAGCRIVHGHVVWEAAKKLGIAEVSCVAVDHLNENEARSLSIALNRLGERGTWEFDALQVEFEELVAIGEDMVITGFDTAEVDMILSGAVMSDEEDLNAIPHVTANPTSRRGDVWILGDHRLIQGDARDPVCYAQLMRDEIARLVLTDVPYNVSVRTITKNEKHREFAMASGELDRGEFVEFNRAWMRAASERLVDGGLLSTAIDWRGIGVVMDAALELGLEHVNTCIWTKTNAGQGSLWRSAYEEYPFFRKGAAAHINNVALGRHGRWRSNVWCYPGASTLGSDSREGLQLHPTVKPRALIEDAILDVTHRGDVVVDCFAGSGTAVVAAEATARRCMALEIDSGYCDVTIKRWQEMTGELAILEEGGESFASVKEARDVGTRE